MPPQTEILVHISGPSRGSDDERYRRQARGLLDFEPIHTHTISRHTVKPYELSTHESNELSTTFPSNPLRGDPGSDQRPISLSGELVKTREILLKELESITPAHVSTLKRSLDTPVAANAAVASPAQPWTGVKETPRLLVERTPFPPRPRTAPDGSMASSAASHRGKQPMRRTQSDSWQTPPSVVPDSQPQQSSSDDHRTASSPILPIKPAFFQSSSPSPDKDKGFSSPPAKRARRSSPSPPSTNPLDDLSSGSLTTTAASPRQEQPPLPLPTLLPPTQRRSWQTSPTPRPPSKNYPNDDDDRPSSPLPLAPLLPSSSQDNVPPSASPSIILSDLPLLIEPPRPPVGNGSFKTHLTKPLYVLFKMPALQRHKLPPTSCRRVVAKLERGHWRIPLSAMDEGRKVKFWRYLMEYVGTGKAGWGVRCARETIRAAKEEGSWRRRGGSGSDKENVTPEEGAERERRVDLALIYCWGEVIEHVWLVLFLAGKHRVRGVGARWIDSAGKTVVEVG